MSEEKNQNEIEEVTNEDEHKDVEHYCYLCRRPESAAGKMLELPNNIFICTDCMQRTLNSMAMVSLDLLTQEIWILTAWISQR